MTDSTTAPPQRSVSKTSKALGVLAFVLLRLRVLVVMLVLLPVGIFMIVTGKNDTPGWLLVFLGACVFLLIVVIAVQWRLRQDMIGAARELGFQPGGQNGQVRQLGLTRYPFEFRANHPVKSFMLGAWKGHRALMFFFPHLGSSNNPVDYWIDMVEMPGYLPWLELHPRKNKRRRFYLGDDVTVDSAEFNARWRVKCRDAEFAREFLHPGVIQRLIALGADGVPVTFNGRRAYIWTVRRDAKEESLVGHFDLLADLVAMIPAQVWRKYGSDSPIPEPGDDGAASAGLAQQYGPTWDKNNLASLSILFSLLLFFPVGIFLGHWAIRAYRKGEASNFKTAVVGTVLGYAVGVFLGVVYLLASLGY
jgi:hypothetical protein